MNYPPPTYGRYVQSPATGAVFQEYAMDDILVLHREPDPATAKKATRHELAATIIPAIAVLVNFGACLSSLYFSVVRDGAEVSSVVAATAGSFAIMAVAFMVGVFAHLHWVRCGPVENHVNIKHWHRLYGWYLKDLTENINGDLVAVWKRNELVIRKLGLWRE